MIPKTLLQFAGAPLHPSSPEDAILVLIDYQREYTVGSLPLHGVDRAVAEARRLLDAARARRLPILHVVHHGRPAGGLFDPNGPTVGLIPGLQPLAQEGLVVKSLPNAFAGTDLQAQARATKRRDLIIAGFATHMCVSATTRAALDLGWRCTVVAGATATRDLPNPVRTPLSTDVIPAIQLQESSLAALADRFAVVVPDTAAVFSDQAVSPLRSNP